MTYRRSQGGSESDRARCRVKTLRPLREGVSNGDQAVQANDGHGSVRANER